MVDRKVSLQLSDREAIAMLEEPLPACFRTYPADSTMHLARPVRTTIAAARTKKGKTRQIVASMYEHHGVSGILTNPPEAASHRLIKLNTRNYDGRD